MGKEQKKEFLIDGVIVAFLSFVTFVFLFYFAKEKTFWMDDIAQMDFSWQNSFGQMLQRLQDQDNTPPLTHILTYLWIHMVPFGTRNLKLFNIIFTILGYVECYRLATLLRDRIAGVMAYVIGATSASFISMTAYTFRPYGFLFFIVTLCYRLFCCCQLKPDQVKLRVLYTISMIALLYTHYFGTVVLLCMGMSDLVFALSEKRKKKSLFISYVVAGLSFVPWLCLMLSRSITRLEEFWPSVPTWSKVLRTIKIMFSYRTIFVVLLVLGVILSFWKCVGSYLKKQERAIKNKKKRRGVIKSKINEKEAADKEENERMRFKLILVSQIIWIAVILITFVFSVSSGRFGSLYVDRYFVCVVPFMFLGVGNCISVIIEMLDLLLFHSKGRTKKGWMEPRQGKKAIIFEVVAVCVLVLICYAPFKSQLADIAGKASEPYEKCSDYLMQQPEIYDLDTMVFCTNYDLAKGWEYYWTKKGQLEQMPQVVYYLLAPEQLTEKNTVYVVVLHTGFSQQVQDILEQSGFVPQSQHESLPIVKYVRQ